jgi:autotransporter strand-loop-strand O-heptosyltransferase
MKEILIQEYENTNILGIPTKKPKNNFLYSFVGGATCEISGPLDQEYKIKFFDSFKNHLIHESIISNNMWTRTSAQYFVPWRIEVYNNKTQELVDTHHFNAKGKRVYIHLDSAALGDTLAWFPYIDEFRKTHQCHVITSTHHNDWFESNYPNLEFITPGTVAENIYAKFAIGWFYNDKELDLSKHPVDVKTVSMQQTSTSILGLQHKEIKPKLTFPDKGQQIEGDYVVIAPHASAHAKYWMYPGGWQKVIDYLNEKGYKVLLITQEPLGDNWHDSKLGGTLKNVIDKSGSYPLEDRYNDILYAKAFIGLGSGLSWLAWTTPTPIILISGFSKPYTEFQNCIRIHDYSPNLCTGCFNKHWLDPGDWEWCPEHKNTSRHFECTKNIKPETIINALNKTLNIY